MTNFNDGFILSTTELKELLEKAFMIGILSHDSRDMEGDICWEKVHKKREEEVLAILSDLNSNVVTNLAAITLTGTPISQSFSF